MNAFPDLQVTIILEESRFPERENLMLRISFTGRLHDRPSIQHKDNQSHSKWQANVVPCFAHWVAIIAIAIVFGLRQGVFSKELFAKRGKVRIFGVNTRIKSVMPFLSEEIW